MKTFLLFLFIILYCPGLLGQQVVATAGGTLENSYGSISYTIVETVAQTLSKNDKILTQGFHQTNLVVSALIELKDLGYTISAFPNPTTDFVKLKISKEIVNGMQYLLFDLTGRLVSQKKDRNQRNQRAFSIFTGWLVHFKST